jgi:CO dehydrogenase maturation factor
MKTLVTMGRGGTGKTTFVTLMARYFIRNKKTPVLLVDADPDQNLAEMVGVDLEREGIRTISELIMETFINKGGTTIGIPPVHRIETKIWERGLYEGRSFDLIAVGTKWIEGCYCMPDAALRGALESLVKNYRYVLIDSPAGLEHLNRRITSRVDILFDVLGPSNKSFEHVKRAHRIAREVGIAFDHFYIIGGCLFPEGLEDRAGTATGQQYLGKIAFDPAVQESVIAGRSLLDIPDDSPAVRSVELLMDKAGLSGT